LYCISIPGLVLEIIITVYACISGISHDSSFRRLNNRTLTIIYSHGFLLVRRPFIQLSSVVISELASRTNQADQKLSTTLPRRTPTTRFVNRIWRTVDMISSTKFGIVERASNCQERSVW